MTTKAALTFCLLSLAQITGCKPDDDNPTLSGGKGGNASLRVSPKHHSRVIDSCTVYIKYKSKDASSSYDDSTRVMLNGGERVALFSGLLKGNYYLYGRGWDSAISDHVIGGIPFEITEEKVHSITLPVTEGD